MSHSDLARMALLALPLLGLAVLTRAWLATRRFDDDVMARALDARFRGVRRDGARAFAFVVADRAGEGAIVVEPFVGARARSGVVDTYALSLPLALARRPFALGARDDDASRARRDLGGVTCEDALAALADDGLSLSENARRAVARLFDRATLREVAVTEGARLVVRVERHTGTPHEIDGVLDAVLALARALDDEAPRLVTPDDDALAGPGGAPVAVAARRR